MSCSPSYVVKIMMRASGNSERIWTVASTPPRFGILKSITTTSGWCCRYFHRRLCGRLVPPRSAKWWPRSYICSVQSELQDGDAIRGRNLNHEDSTGQQNLEDFRGGRREASKDGL